MRTRTDIRSINYPMLVKVMGWLLLIEGAFMCVPAVVAACYREADWTVFGASALITMLVGFMADRMVKPQRSAMAKREGFLLTAMTWVVFSIFGMLPFLFCSSPLNLTDAFFESMAGFTTTGCSAYADADVLSHGVNIWRALMQWVGGMGIIIFTIAVIPMLNHSGGVQMFNAEVTGITHEKIRPRISSTAKSLWGVYALLSLVCTLLLWAGPMSLFDSICHAFGTVSTGGFSTHAKALHYWDSPYLDSVVTLFMFLGGTNFAVIYFTAHGNLKPLRQNGTFKAYVISILAFYTMFVVDILWHGNAHNASEALLMPLFQVVSACTSTGYTVSMFASWGVFAFALLIPMTLFGGCAGSTSGGVKIDRMVVTLKYLRNSLRRVFEPNKVTSVSIDGRVLPPDIVSKAVSFLCLFCILAFTGGIVLTLFDVPLVTSFFTSLSCMTNSGISADIAGQGMPISAMPMAVKWVLSALMLIGRLEVFTILILFLPAFWQR